MNISDITNIIVSITSIFAIFIAIHSYKQQTNQAKLHLGIQILREFEDLFFRSDNTRSLRYMVCKHYKEHGTTGDTPPEVWRLADEFGSISYYINKGFVDIEASWAILYYWFDIYYYLFNYYIDDLKYFSGGVDHLSDFRHAHELLTKYGESKQNLLSQAERYCQNKINTFIDDEILETYDRKWGK